MPDLYKTFDIATEVIDADDAAEPTYGTSWAWDFAAGDFEMSAGRLSPVDGYQAWVQWCVKAALTERGAYLVYSDDHGSDLDELRAQGSRGEVEAYITDAITDALEVDIRTGGVSDFTFAWDGDRVDVSFIAEPATGTPERVSLSMIA